MNNMKLYTEQQVEEAYLSGRFTRLSFEEVLKEYTPIELPTEEEIRNVVFDYIEPPKQKPEESDGYNEYDIFCSFNVGAKWAIEHVKKQFT